MSIINGWSSTKKTKAKNNNMQISFPEGSKRTLISWNSSLIGDIKLKTWSKRILVING